MRKLGESQRKGGIIVAKIFRINRTKDKGIEKKRTSTEKEGRGVRQRARDKHQGNLKER
jgi:hypothetical protein